MEGSTNEPRTEVALEEESYTDTDDDSAGEWILEDHEDEDESDSDYVDDEDDDGSEDDGMSFIDDAEVLFNYVIEKKEDKIAEGHNTLIGNNDRKEKLSDSLHNGFIRQFNLNWRTNPSESFSDWTIEIKSEECTTLYHVHRAILSFGAKKCSYFENTFRCDTFSECAQRKSSIDLSSENQLSEAFPDFLDYLYSLPTFVITRDNVMQLRALAHYFIVPSLLSKTKDFIKSDMSDFDLVSQLIVEFDSSDDEDAQEIMARVACECTERFYEIATSSPLLDHMSPVFFMHLVQDVKQPINQEKLKRMGHKDHVVKLILAYATGHKEVLTAKFFIALFIGLEQPCVSTFNVASDLLAIIGSMGWDLRSNECTSGDHDSIVGLIEQCSKVMARHDKENKNIHNADDALAKIPRDAILCLLDFVVAKSNE